MPILKCNNFGMKYDYGSLPDITEGTYPVFDDLQLRSLATRDLNYAPPRPITDAPSLGFSVGDVENIPGADWSNILKKVLGVGAMAGGVGSLFGYGGSTTNFTPSMTAASARQMTAQAGTRAKQGISTQASLAKANVGSQYVGRGLGSAGAAIGDIAGIGVQAGQAAGMVDIEMNQQLAQMLMEIDRQEFMRQSAKSQEQRDIWSTLGDLALSAGMLFL